MLTPQQEEDLRNIAQRVGDQLYEQIKLSQPYDGLLAEMIDKQDFFQLQVVQVLSQNVTRTRVENEHSLRKWA